MLHFTNNEKNIPKPIGFVYSPLWKITHQTPLVLCTPPFEKSPIKRRRGTAVFDRKGTMNKKVEGSLTRNTKMFRVKPTVTTTVSFSWFTGRLNTSYEKFPALNSLKIKRSCDSDAFPETKETIRSLHTVTLTFFTWKKLTIFAIQSYILFLPN